MRPIIRPGLQLLRRDMHTLQLGRGWPGPPLLVDSPALQAVLGAVDGFRDTTAVVLTAAAAGAGASVKDCAAALDSLIEAGAVVDQSATRRADCPEPLWSSLWLLAGPRASADDMLGRRRAGRVHVSGDGVIADTVRDVLVRGQITVTDHAGTAGLVVVADVCEPDRGRSDAALRSGLPHLWAYQRDLVGIVGPFVDPGVSACLRCVDTARSELDPAWATTVAAPRPLVPPDDPVLGSAVGSLAAQEVAVWVAGRRPQTVDAVLEIPYGVGTLQRRPHTLHPQCGCGWATWHDTMGA